MIRIRHLRKRVPYFMRWDLVFAKTTGDAGSQTCRRSCGTSMERRRKGRAFCESDSAKDMQVFLQYVDGEAVQKLIVVSMAREWGDISSGLLCRMMRMRAFGIRGKVTAKGCVILFSEHTPCPGAEHTKQTEGRGTWVVFRSVFLLSLVLYKSYGMPGILRGNA